MMATAVFNSACINRLQAVENNIPNVIDTLKQKEALLALDESYIVDKVAVTCVHTHKQLYKVEDKKGDIHKTFTKATVCYKKAISGPKELYLLAQKSDVEIEKFI